MPLQLIYFQKGFNFSQDGPGNRLVYHLRGCNMHCPWCANPEGMSFCSSEECEALARFGACSTPQGKLMSHTPESLTAEALSCAPAFFPAGGVTFTGGEPTAQADALRTTLRLLHDNKISTALESNASSPHLAKMLCDIDYLMLDLKQAIPEKHLLFTGIDNEIVLSNITLAAKTREQLAIRLPLIGGYNSSDEDMEAFCAFLSELPKKKLITLEVLPYHEYGLSKWKKLGLDYTVRDAKITPGRLRECKEILSRSGINIVDT